MKISPQLTLAFRAKGKIDLKSPTLSPSDTTAQPKREIRLDPRIYIYNRDDTKPRSGRFWLLTGVTPTLRNGEWTTNLLNGGAVPRQG